MSSYIHALALRAVASKHWQWMAGMAFLGPVDDDAHMACYRYPGDGQCAENGVPISDITGALPDFEDAPTVGGLLALVRKAWGNEYGFAQSEMDNAYINEMDDESAQQQAALLAAGEDIGWIQCIEGDMLKPRLLLPHGRQWTYHPHGQEPDPVEMGQHQTEIEALVDALEKAP